jgi:hypothetical protein
MPNSPAASNLVLKTQELSIGNEKDYWTLVGKGLLVQRWLNPTNNFQLPTSSFLKTEGHVFSNPLYKLDHERLALWTVSP